ncbi:MAG TPA: hypothetical protein VKA30_07005, partial [Actinomycetota bacterium]|nr:hypothetical protein [Actinomycetota bacterium]
NVPDGLSVSVRGTVVRVGFARRGAASVEVQVGYGGRDLSSRVVTGSEAQIDLEAVPTTSGHLLLLYRDAGGRVFFAKGVALPSGDSAAG